jgi:hypothetical protein
MMNKILHHDVKHKNGWFYYLCRQDYITANPEKVAFLITDVTCKNCLRILGKLKEDLDPRR